MYCYVLPSIANVCAYFPEQDGEHTHLKFWIHFILFFLADLKLENLKHENFKHGAIRIMKLYLLTQGHI